MQCRCLDVNKVTDPVNVNRDVNKVTGSVDVNKVTDPVDVNLITTILPLVFPDDIKLNDFILEQNIDNECDAAMKYLSQDRKIFDVTLLGGLKPYKKNLHVENNLLYWKNRIVVPKNMRARMLAYCHDHPMAGHFAVERTLQRFNDTFFWPKAEDDVHIYVNSCGKCNGFNYPCTSYGKAPLQPITTSRRFEFVCYDIAGPFLPVTVRGNRYVLIVVEDHYSRWPEFGSINAPVLAISLVDQWCCRYGIPQGFHSDGCSNVHGEVMKEVLKLLGINKTKSSRLHPQGDGLAESFVKTQDMCSETGRY